MIDKIEPLSMPETLAYISKSKDKEKDIIGFIKKFSKVDQKDALTLRKKLRELDLIKINEEHISKIINIMPENLEEVNKIFTDVGLDEDETKKILETVKQFK